jgi:long-chain acyl-CoA synthetase
MTVLHRLLTPALEKAGASLSTIDGSVLDAAGIQERAGAVAAALVSAGVRENEPVLLMIRNEPEDVPGFLGIWQAGAVAVPCHISTPTSAVGAQRDRAGYRFEVHGGLLRTSGGIPAPYRAELEGAALIVYTSGSTGKPKGVVVGHEALSYKLRVLSNLLALQERDAVLCPLQLTFIFGIWVTLLGMFSGCRTILVPKFSPTSIVDALGRSAVFAAVPSMLRALMELRHPISVDLKKILTGGEPLGVALARQLKDAFPQAELFDLYGSTETGSCDFCLTPADQPAGFGTIGRTTKGVSYRIAPVPGHAESGEGELQIQTRSRMLGYLDDAQQTASAFSEGFFKTGDLARRRQDGLVELAGRLKDIISRGGNKIAPLEIDALFAAHPDVKAALTTGVPDPILGETVHVLILIKQGASTTASSLREWAFARVEKFKVPDAIHFVDALPAGVTGKVDRRAAAKIAIAMSGE